MIGGDAIWRVLGRLRTAAETDGSANPHCLVFGLSLDSGGSPAITRDTYRFDKLVQKLLHLLKASGVPPDFLFSTVHINYDTVARSHEEDRFIGRSLIAGFGTYSRGEMVIGGKDVDIRHKWVAYYGDCEHSSKDFEGIRYSVVLYLDAALWSVDFRLILDLKAKCFLWNAPAGRPAEKRVTEQVGAHVEGSDAWLRQNRMKEAEAETSEEDEDGVLRPRLGEGMCGIGPPLHVTLAGRQKPFHDGGGLCSLGRWCHRNRPTPSSEIGIRTRIRWSRILRGSTPASEHFDMKRAFCELLCNKRRTSPFSAEMISEGRRVWVEELAKQCARPIVQQGPPEEQTLWLNHLSEHARLSEDTDYRYMVESTVSLAKGVITGVGRRMPRVPSVFERKVKWGHWTTSPRKRLAKVITNRSRGTRQPSRPNSSKKRWLAECSK